MTPRGSKQQEEMGMGGTQRRRVSFAPIPTGSETSPVSESTNVDVSSFHQDEDPGDNILTEQESTQKISTSRESLESIASVSPTSSHSSSVPGVEQSSPLTGTSETHLSPGSDMSEEGGSGSSLSSSTSIYELPQVAKRGRGGRRGRGRRRGKRGRGRGGAVGEDGESIGDGKEEAVVRGRGGRGRKRRGRGARYVDKLLPHDHADSYACIQMLACLCIHTGVPGEEGEEEGVV